MQLPRDCVLLRVYLGEKERYGHSPLYEAIVMKAREFGMAGATVLRGPIGYGRSSRIHSAKILDLSEDLPMVVEIVDSAERMEGFLDVLRPLMGGGLVTLEKVQVLQYGPTATEEPGPNPG